MEPLPLTRVLYAIKTIPKVRFHHVLGKLKILEIYGAIRFSIEWVFIKRIILII